MQSCVHSLFVFLPDRPTHLYEREGDGKRNIFWESRYEVLQTNKRRNPLKNSNATPHLLSDTLKMISPLSKKLVDSEAKTPCTFDLL